MFGHYSREVNEFVSIKTNRRFNNGLYRYVVLLSKHFNSLLAAPSRRVFLNSMIFPGEISLKMNAFLCSRTPLVLTRSQPATCTPPF